MCVKKNDWYQEVLESTTANAFNYDDDLSPHEKYILATAGGTDRESYIIENFYELENDDHKHGYDAIMRKTGEPVEIKSEVQQGVKTVASMSGKASWSSTMDEEMIEKHVKNNPHMYHSGWCSETGKCSYVLRYRFNESRLADQLRNAITGSAKTCPNSSYLDFKDANVEILYFDPDTRHQMTSKFADFIFQKLDKNRLVDLVKKGYWSIL